MKKLYFLFIILFFLQLNVSAQKNAAPNSVSAFYSYLTSVYFVSSYDGWVVGDNGVILNTTDGGTNWTLQTSGTKKWLKKVVFIDKNTGFAIGENGTILHTSNGGKTWIQQKSNTSNDLEDVFFSNKENGVAVGFYKILKTTNGGMDWTSISNDEIVWNCISFSDANNGWIAGSGGAIWKTTDGGSNWQHLSEYNQYSVAWYTDIAFIDKNNGLSVDDFYGIHKTTDGGITWTDLYYTGGNSNIIYSIFHYNVNIAFAVGYVNNKNIMLKTTDGGLTWFSQTIETNSTLRDVFFTDQNNGIIVGSGDILKTTNGGSDWIAQKNIYGNPFLSQPTNNSLGIELKTTFSWNDELFNSGSYHLQISTDSTFSSLYFNDSTITTQSEYYSNKAIEVNNLSEGTTYYWRVRDKINNVYGPWSEVWKFTTIGKSPFLFSPVNDTTLSPLNISLKWSNTTGTINYRLQVSTDSLFGTIALDKDNITGNSTTINLKYGTKYYWHVGAKNNDGKTYWSKFLTFRTKGTPRRSFPLAIGNKWYYKANANYQNYYGVVKEITDTLSDGTRVVVAKYFYNDSTTTKKESWKYKDGKFYIPSNVIIYNDYLTQDSCANPNSSFDNTCWSFINYKVFGINDTAQEYSTHFGMHGSSTAQKFVLLPDIGIVKTYNWNYFSGLSIKEDSSYLVGMYKNGIVLGDTTLHNPADSTTAHFPLELGQRWIYNVYTVYPIYAVYKEINYQSIVDSGTVIKEVTKILDNGFREITITTKYPDSTIVKKEYWLSKDGEFYMSEKPDLSSAELCYSAALMGRDCIRKTDGRDFCITWKTDKFNFKDKLYDAQYFTVAFPATSPNKYHIIANGLGPVKLEFRPIRGSRKEALTDVTTDINIRNNPQPKNCALSQNYPNPFNPVTTIKYQIPHSAFVSLKIYDVLGKEVATLVNEEKKAGYYDVNFNGSSLSSGVYFYRLQSGSFVETKKLILMK